MITFTTDIAKAHRFTSWTAAGNFAGANHGSRGPIPVSWRMREMSGDNPGTIIHIPGISDQYVESIAAPDEENSMEPLGPEYGYGQTFGQDVDIVSDLIKALQQCDPQAAVRIQGYTTKTLHSIRNVRDTFTTTGDPLVMIRSY